MKNIVIELMVDNMKDTVKYYTDILGFSIKISFPEDNPFFVSILNENVEIMLYTREEFSKEIPKFKDMKVGGSIALFIEVSNIKDMYKRIKGRVNIVQELHDTSYGTTEFSIEDINGYILMFNEKN